MKKGTFSVVKAGKNSTAHNSRLEIPNYLIDSSSKNYYELITPDQNFIIEAQEKYKLTVNQKMQKSQLDNLILETCISIKPNHNVNDLKNLFLKLNEKYGGHELLELSIHRDEGHFLKDEIAYYPTKNILNKNGDWFICSNSEILRPKFEDFDKLVNINDFEKVLNLHAHAKFSMFDRQTGKSARMTKKTMSERIKFVSEFLELDYNPQKNRKVRKSVNLIKDEHLIKNRVFEKVQTMQNEINLKNDEIKKLKIELEKNQDLIYTKKLNKDGQRISFRTYAEYYRNELEKLKLNFDLIMNENKSLQEQNSILESKVITLEEKINSSSNMNDYEAIKKENESLKKENSFLKRVLDKVLIYANSKIKELINFGKTQVKQSVSFEDFSSQIMDEDMASKTADYSKMNLADILNSNKADLKEAQDNLKELINENQNVINQKLI